MKIKKIKLSDLENARKYWKNPIISRRIMKNSQLIIFGGDCGGKGGCKDGYQALRID